MPDEQDNVATWEELAGDGGAAALEALEDGNQGGLAAAPTSDPPPAIPSEAVAPDPADKTTEAKTVTDDPGKAATDANASTDDPAKLEPPVSDATGKDKVDLKPEDDEEESEEDKAEFADLPEKAQAPARRYRRDSRQYKALQNAIGGEEFLEDAKLLVPAFHTQPPEKFDALLAARSPIQRNRLVAHMVFGSIEDDLDRPHIIKALVTDYAPELKAALGVDTAAGDKTHTPESHVEPAATGDLKQSLETLDDYLSDQYLNDEQRTAITAAKTALEAKTRMEQELSDLRKRVEEIAAAPAPSVDYAKEEEALGGEFLTEVFQFADTRLDQLGLSAVEGDSPEVVNYIKEEREKIRERLPSRFEAHDNAKLLINKLEEKFKLIPKLAATQKDAEKKAAWRFLPPVKACVDEILGRETASCLKAIEAMRGAQQAPSNQGQRKEIVGHQAPGQIDGGIPLVEGKGTDALWADVTGPTRSSNLGA